MESLAGAKQSRRDHEDRGRYSKYVRMCAAIERRACTRQGRMRCVKGVNDWLFQTYDACMVGPSSEICT